MRSRRGFSLSELLVVLTILALLVRFGFPRYNHLRKRAEARSMLGDVQAVRVAAYNYTTEKGGWPADAPAGAVPPQLVTYLPGGFEFQRLNYTLDWEVWPTPNGVGGNAATSVVIGLAVATSDSALADAVRSAAKLGIPYLVSGTTTTFLLAGVGGNY